MTSASPPRTAGGVSSASEASSSANPSTGSSVHTAPRLRPPRSLPPWIATYDQSYGSISEEQLRLLNPPVRAARPQHNSTPYEPQRRVSRDGFIANDDPELGPPQEDPSRFRHFLRYGRAPRRGRQWDHLRNAEPVIVSAYSSKPRQPAMAWNEFIQSSAWGHAPNEKSKVVAPEYLDELQPNFNQKGGTPFDPIRPRLSRRRKTMKLSKVIWKQMMRSSLAPILFRLVVMITSIMALGLSARLFQLEDAVEKDSAERTQSVVAVVIDCVAIPFIAYTIWDELTGKPLGLRSAVNKISLILLDLFFIIFKSASTALAFETVVYHTLGGSSIVALTKALAGVMLLGLLSWSINFTMNIFRTVVKLGGGDDDDDDDE
ncbi:hypothetical protein PT974_00748 [Cladobotryum mycophilum]|uniref:MARVEL domain-containing protein n=1 Tax=Cladobotryum mycophilum TaxID=491253 RepID=A0ABR0T1Q7_9HYPO